MNTCIFCRIASGEASANIIYRDDKAVAFHDINPQAPVHILIIPRKHIARVSDMTPEDESLIGHLHYVATIIARDLKIEDEGYRLVFNVGRYGGQHVYHIHLHLLGGRPMGWPPG